MVCFLCSEAKTILEKLKQIFILLLKTNYLHLSQIFKILRLVGLPLPTH